MTFYAYIYRDPSKDMQPFYVGKGSKTRANSHLKRCDHHPMTYRIQSMKREGVEPDIEIIKAINEDHAFLIESCLIEIFGRRDLKTGTLLNLTDGGDGASGSIRSPETRAKMSLAAKNASPETRAKISASCKKTLALPEVRAKMSVAAKNISPETRAKMSLAAKNKSPEHRAAISTGRKGKKHSDEARAKISAAGKGKPRSDETRAKISQGLSGKTKSLEHRIKMAESSKKALSSPEVRAKLSAAAKAQWVKRKAST